MADVMIDEMRDVDQSEQQQRESKALMSTTNILLGPMEGAQEETRLYKLVYSIVDELNKYGKAIQEQMLEIETLEYEISKQRETNLELEQRYATNREELEKMNDALRQQMSEYFTTLQYLETANANIQRLNSLIATVTTEQQFIKQLETAVQNTDQYVE